MQYFARPSIDGQEFQPLHEHIKNVAEYAALFGKRNHLSAICRLLAYLHDMGKYSLEFQRYIREIAEDIQKEKRSSPSRVDHGSYGAAYLYVFVQPRIEKQNSNTKIKGILHFFTDFLAMCLAYHHGGLDDYLSIETIKSPIKSRLQSFIDETTEQTSLKKVKTTFFEDCINQFELNKLEDLALDEFLALLERISNAPYPDKNRKANQRSYDVQLILKYAYSCLIDADRLDAYNYSATEPLGPEASIVPYLDEYIEKLEQKLQSFQSKDPGSESEKNIVELRASISNECRSAAKWETGTYTLTVPTGGGKTFASLRFALEHARYHAGTESEKTQIIYVLPYTTIIEQNADEVRETLSCSTNLLEHHTNVSFSDDECDEEYKLFTERWDVPIIFTTQV
ncbi:MAG TPA: CRISPR-associated endonuclease Cas3'' [Clostridiaceae bacterium]|nr:CRISPR-associated endonuclease Cas3'' [Clostridiaceae bacterium]